ncbi:hypothetical protein D3C80_1718420 [compost metagenome]
MFLTRCEYSAELFLSNTVVLAFDIMIATSLISTPMEVAPNTPASIKVVPEPQKGSSTVRLL